MFIFQEAVKMAKTRDVDDAVSYLKQQFWQYGTNEFKYNYTRNEFKVTVCCSLSVYCLHFISSTYYYFKWKYFSCFNIIILFTRLRIPIVV